MGVGPDTILAGAGIAKLIKELMDGFRKTKDIAGIDKLVMLQSMLQDLREENFELKEENSSLKESVSLKEKMVFKSPNYYQDGDEHPFCSVCWEKDNKPIHLKEYKDGKYYCLVCENESNKPVGTL